jgi:ankyrin repeat protein
MRSEARLFYLLGEGANPNILTKKGRNALHLACRARQSNIVGYLCQVSFNISFLLPPQTFRVSIMKYSSE